MQICTRVCACVFLSILGYCLKWRIELQVNKTTKENPHTLSSNLLVYSHPYIYCFIGRIIKDVQPFALHISRSSFRFRLDCYLCFFSLVYPNTLCSSLYSSSPRTTTEQQLKPKRTKQFQTNISNWSNVTRWDRIKPAAPSPNLKFKVVWKRTNQHIGISAHCKCKRVCIYRH